MSQTGLSSWIARRIIVAAGAIALTLAGVAPVAAEPRDSQASLGHAPTIDTYSGWDGSDFRGDLSLDAPTVGQVITVPSDETNILRFKFFMRPNIVDGQLVARGEVYRWNGTSAAGQAVWESAPRTLAFRGQYQHVVPFHVHGISLRADAQYVLFVSISKDYEQGTPDYSLIWPDRADNPYAGGDNVYLLDGGDESQWTSVPWGQFDGHDMALQVWLRP